MTADSGKCGVPCEGLYADVEESTDFADVSEREELSKLLIQYEDFKSGFNKKNMNSKKIAGMLLTYLVLYVKIINIYNTY